MCDNVERNEEILNNKINIKGIKFKLQPHSSIIHTKESLCKFVYDSKNFPHSFKYRFHNPQANYRVQSKVKRERVDSQNNLKFPRHKFKENYNKRLFHKNSQDEELPTNIIALDSQNDDLLYKDLYNNHNLVLAFNSNEHVKKWGRGLLLDIKQTSSLSSKVLSIFFIDYGNIEHMEENLDQPIFIKQEIPYNINKYPPYLIPCSLFGLDVKNETNYKKVNDLFYKILSSKKLMEMKLEMHHSKGYYLVTLYSKDDFEKNLEPFIQKSINDTIKSILDNKIEECDYNFIRLKTILHIKKQIFNTGYIIEYSMLNK
ncbi:unnamed protein product [Gordionus sp. m RMFG-2023]